VEILRCNAGHRSDFVILRVRATLRRQSLVIAITREGDVTAELKKGVGVEGDLPFSPPGNGASQQNPAKGLANFSANLN
jgi:hypothetical protein